MIEAENTPPKSGPLEDGVGDVVTTFQGLVNAMADLDRLGAPPGDVSERFAHSAKLFGILSEAQYSLAMMGGQLAFHLRQYRSSLSTN